LATSPLTLATPAASWQLLSAHLYHFAQGAWIADLEIDPASIASSGLPSGRVTATVGGVPLSGTIDARNSGTWGPTGKVRVVAGGNGWDQVVPRQDFHNDATITSTQIYQSTAAVIGETVNDLTPAVLGIDFVRSGSPGAGPASRVFRDLPWWVSVTGVTNIGPRPSSTPDASLVIQSWDPIEQKITFSCDTLLYPATALSDSRFGSSSPTVYDVEQVFDSQGSTGWAWSTSAPCSQLVADLKSACLEWTRAAQLRTYRYRLIQYQGARAALQAVNPIAGMPDLIPLAQWSGLPGSTITMAPSQEVLVAFENADPTLPRIVSYNGQGTPIAMVLDAQTSFAVGPSAAAVAIAGGANALVPAPWASALITALTTFASGLTPTTLAAQASAFVTELGTLGPSATTKTKAT
jgi:hypothetical protein